MRMRFFPIEWNEVDSVRDVRLIRKKRKEKDEDDEDIEEDDELAPTFEVRCWASMKDNRRSLIRFQNAPVHAYLQITPTVPLKSKSGVKWDAQHAGELVRFLNAKLQQAALEKKKSPMKITTFSLVQRQLLHFYHPGRGNRPFLLLFFNTRSAARMLETIVNGTRYKGDRYNAQTAPVHIVSAAWQRARFRLHEVEVSPLTYMMARQNASMSDWFTCKTEEIVSKHESILVPGLAEKGFREFLGDWKTIRTIPDQAVGPIRTMSFDIETVNYHDDRFPDPVVPENEIFQISASVEDDMDTKRNRAILFTTLDPKEKRRVYDGLEYDIVVCPSEKQLLIRFFQFVRDVDADMILGYNSDKFDAFYIDCRCRLLAIADEDVNIARTNKWNRPSQFSEYHMPGKNGKDVVKRNWKISGRISFDMINYIMRSHKLASYKLNNVAKEILGKEKLDMTAKRMFEMFRRYKDGERSEELTKEIRECSDYCTIDTRLVQQILVKENLKTLLVEFSNINHVPMSMLYSRGQQIRVFSHIVTNCVKEGRVIDKQYWDYVQTAGAYVQEPEPGIYENVIALDFSSLYPSIIRAFNLCYTTLVPKSLYDVVPKEDCHVFEIDQYEAPLTEELKRQLDYEEKTADLLEYEDENVADEDLEIETTDAITYRPSEWPATIKASDLKHNAKRDNESTEINTAGFAKISPTPVGKNIRANTELALVQREIRFIKQEKRLGFIPCILNELIQARNDTKAEMKKYDKESYEYKRLDNRQNALKITANATYGFYGAQLNGLLPCPEAFICVTSRGRELITTVNRYLRNTYNATIVYGDTDSTMFIVPGVEKGATIPFAKALSKEIKHLYPDPLDMAFEKTMRMVIFKPKMYAYYKLNMDGDTDAFQRFASGEIDMKVMGLKPTRRDNCTYQSHLFKSVLKQMLELEQPHAILRTIIDAMATVLDPKTPLREFSISKGIGTYTEGNQTAMAVLQRKMGLLGFPIEAGDRVDYIQHLGPEKKKSERFITLDYLDANPDSPWRHIDYEWYLYDAIKNMNSYLKVSFMTWKRNHPRRTELLDSIQIEIKRQGKTYVIPFAQDPIYFFSEIAKESKRRNGDVVGRFKRTCDKVARIFETEKRVEIVL